MALARLLEDFGLEVDPGPRPADGFDDAAEEEKLAAFEKGYGAGWEDALRAQSEDRAAISDALVRTIEDLGFTYHEARAQITAALTPVLEEIADRVVPRVLSEGLGVRVLEILRGAIDDAARPAVEIVASPARAPLLAELLPRQDILRVSLAVQDDLDDDRVFIRLAGAESVLDIAELETAIREAIAAFCHQAREDARHG